MTFDPSQHLSAARKNGPQDYLAVKWRLVWFREEHPDGSIETECLRDTPESAAFKATVSIPGKGKATGHGDETIQDFRDFYTKAETKAIGRALAALGYGTQFVGNELDEGERIVDSPTPRRTPAPASTGTPAPAANGAQPAGWTQVWATAKPMGYADRAALDRLMGRSDYQPAEVLERLRNVPAGNAG